MIDLVRGDEAALSDILILYIDHVGRDATNAREKCFAAVVLEVERIAGLRADLGAGFAIVAQPFVISDIEPLVAAHRALPLLRSPPPLKSELGDHKVIDAQRLRNSCNNVGV